MEIFCKIFFDDFFITFVALLWCNENNEENVICHAKRCWHDVFLEFFLHIAHLCRATLALNRATLHTLEQWCSLLCTLERHRAINCQHDASAMRARCLRDRECDACAITSATERQSDASAIIKRQSNRATSRQHLAWCRTSLLHDVAQGIMHRVNVALLHSKKKVEKLFF